MITLRGVNKTYGKGKSAFKALKDVSFELSKGSSVAIIGKSGSGKSTLMHAMSGLDRPEQGEIVIDGINILKLKNKQVDQFRSKKIGFIFQSFFVQANETCFDNVSLPLEVQRLPRAKRKKQAEAALRAVGLSDKVKRKAKELSGGQKQRLAIARAIVGEPEILFADEPTGNLDSTTGAKIEKLLFDYNKTKGVTLIIVTHDDELAHRCDVRVYVKDGQVESIDSGKTKTIKKRRLVS